MTKVVVDTSTLVRIFDMADENHSSAARLGEYFVTQGITVRIPFHALFEFGSALKRKNLEGNLLIFKGVH